jgi:hypothetical protein
VLVRISNCDGYVVVCPVIRNIALVRADVARLPFATGSVDAVHAGAAIHCWPSPAAGVRTDSQVPFTSLL